MKNKFNNNLITDIVPQIIWPTRCIACNNILNKTEIKSGFCKCCDAIIKKIRRDICMKCGKSLNNVAKEYCPDCERKPHVFTQARGVFEYSGSMKDAMYRFKYANKRIYAKTFAQEALHINGDWIKAISPSVIVPVPMYKGKQKQRGYNQAEIFARELSKITGISCRNDIVMREKNTKPLKTLSPEERNANLKKAFKKTKVFRKKADILLVDDIFTTGATVNEVSRTLLEANVNRVYCLFICIGK